MLGFLTESSKDFQETTTVGGFRASAGKNSFDDTFTEAWNGMLTNGIDLMIDLNSLLKNKSKVNA